MWKFKRIELLYYPKTPYMFTIIEPSILGKIYESFLTESLVPDAGKIVLAHKKEYIYKSVVSTPVEILLLRIADIACGSGIFLEEVYQYLVDYCTE